MRRCTLNLYFVKLFSSGSFDLCGLWCVFLASLESGGAATDGGGQERVEGAARGGAHGGHEGFAALRQGGPRRESPRGRRRHGRRRSRATREAIRVSSESGGRSDTLE